MRRCRTNLQRDPHRTCLTAPEGTFIRKVTRLTTPEGSDLITSLLPHWVEVFCHYALYSVILCMYDVIWPSFWILISNVKQMLYYFSLIERTRVTVCLSFQPKKKKKKKDSHANMKNLQMLITKLYLLVSSICYDT